MRNNLITRFGLISLLVISAMHCAANPLQADGFESEAQRLEQVRRLIKSELNPRPADLNDKYRQPGSTAPTCSAMLQDLMAGKFKAIEPVQIRTREDTSDTGKGESPITQPDALRGFPKRTTEKLRFCAGPEQEKKIQGVEDRFFLGFDFFAGSPPYRVYRLSKTVNPYLDSDFVYWASPNPNPGYSGWRYTWVNLDICKTVFGTSTSYSTAQEKERPGGNAQAIAIYGGKFTYVEAHKQSNLLIESFEPNSFHANTGGVSQICRWNTYPETTITK